MDLLSFSSVAAPIPRKNQTEGLPLKAVYRDTTVGIRYFHSREDGITPVRKRPQEVALDNRIYSVFSVPQIRFIAVFRFHLCRRQIPTILLRSSSLSVPADLMRALGHLLPSLRAKSRIMGIGPLFKHRTIPHPPIP